MSTPIDIYTYPENATPIQLAEYQLEVMRAAERGEPVEFRDPSGSYGWEPIKQATWNWAGVIYRIARPIRYAEGHNPDGLTEAQVGVRDGWRLLSAEEREARHRYNSKDITRDIERWDGDMWDGAGWVGSWDLRTYRTRHPAGHYLPKPAPEPVAEAHPSKLPVMSSPELVFFGRPSTRRDRIATVVQLIWNRSETADQIAARVEALLAREQASPGLTFTDARNIVGQ